MKEAGPPEDWWKYAQIGIEMAAAVMLGFVAGYKLDARLGTSPWLMLGGSAAGLAAGFYLAFGEMLLEKKR